MRAQKAAVGIDEETLFKLRAKKVDLIAFRIESVTYLTSVKRFFTPGETFYPTRMFGPRSRFMTLNRLVTKRGNAEA